MITNGTYRELPEGLTGALARAALNGNQSQPSRILHILTTYGGEYVGAVELEGGSIEWFAHDPRTGQAEIGAEQYGSVSLALCAVLMAREPEWVPELASGRQ